MLKGVEFLKETLNPGRLTAVVDIGANPIDGDPPYREHEQQRHHRDERHDPRQNHIVQGIEYLIEHEKTSPPGPRKGAPSAGGLYPVREPAGHRSLEEEFTIDIWMILGKHATYRGILPNFAAGGPAIPSGRAAGRRGSAA